VFLARDRQHDLIEVPLVSGCGQTTPDLVGKVLPKLQRPLAHRLVADHDAACSKDFVHVAQAERETEVEPDREADDLGWEAIAGEAGKARRHHPARLPVSSGWRKPANCQVDDTHAIASIAPSVAHQVEFDLSSDAPAAFVMEPGAFELHLWEQATGFVSHTALVEGFPGPFPFLTNPDYPGRSQ